MEKIVVTGGSGQVGYELIKDLVERGFTGAEVFMARYGNLVTLTM